MQNIFWKHFAKDPCGFFAPRLCLLLLSLLLTLVLTPTTANAERLAGNLSPSDVPLEHLLHHAHKQQLPQDPQWLALLHYGNRFDVGGSSRVDDPRFFLSPNGKQDPEAELEATLRHLFTPQKEDSRCRFMARFHWLRERLDPHKKLFPSYSCRRFREWNESLNPIGVTMVFPSAFINSPASAFGHTLLRIDAAGQDEQNRLLAYAASYAAATGGEDPISYALRGVFGGYPGYFTVFPYYDTVKKYSDLEHRDIWEYQLNISPKQTQFLVKHLWELKDIFYHYYYFDENCAYQMLALLEVIWPEEDLIGTLKPWAIPVDVLRAVLSHPKRLQRVVFRPATATVMRHQAAALTPTQQLRAKDIVHNLDADISSIRDPAVVDLAYEYLAYLQTKSALDEEKGERRAFDLLQLRSTLPSATSAPTVPTPLKRPDEGHKTSRLRVAAGNRNNNAYAELSVRGAHHDLLDPLPGFLQGAQIEIFNASLRKEEARALSLEELTLVDLVSLSPRDELLSPRSWRFHSKIKRETFQKDKRHLLSHSSFGYGSSWKAGDSILFALFDTTLKASGHFTDNAAYGTGGQIGFLFTPLESWGMQVSFLGQRFWIDTHSSISGNIEQRITLGENLAARVRFTRQQEYKMYENECALSLDWYF